MAGTRAFQLRFELIAHNPMEGLIGNFERKFLPEPALDVQAAVRARHADVLADAKRHVAAAASDLVRELYPRRRRADDEHTAIIELVGASILFRRQGLYGVGDGRCAGRYVG